jgi:hypothetical protein
MSGMADCHGDILSRFYRRLSMLDCWPLCVSVFISEHASGNPAGACFRGERHVGSSELAGVEA